MLVPLGDAGRVPAGEVGGKARGLGTLIEAGHRVPPGFVIPASAFHEALARSGRGGELADMARGTGAWSSTSLAVRAAGCRRLVEELRPDRDLGVRITEACRELGSRLALRSSAAAEDLPEASFAGQHDTFLELEGAAGVLAHVPRAWASFFSDRAFAYRERLGFEEDEVVPCLVVQAIARTRVSGVLFSRDPRGGRHRLITAAFGLGEGVVSGHVDPDTWTLDPGDGRVLSFRMGEKRLQVVARPDGEGTCEVEALAGERERPCLDDARLAELAAIAARLEKEHGGRPQDVEFGYDDSGLVLFQSRPATTHDGDLAGAVPGFRIADRHVYMNGNLAETCRTPMTALGRSLLDWALSKWILPPGWTERFPRGFRILSWIYGRPYFDASALFLHPRIGRGLALAGIAPLDRHSYRSLVRLFDRDAVRGTWPLGLFATVRLLLGLILDLRRMLPSAFRAWWDIVGARAEFARRTDAAVAELDAIMAVDPGPRGLAVWIGEVLSTRLGPSSRLGLAVLSEWARRMVVLSLFLERWVDPVEGGRLTFVLGTSPEGNHSERMSREFSRVGGIAAEDSSVLAALETAARTGEVAPMRELPAAARFMEAWDDFLAEYGHRGPGEQDMGRPRWVDEPGLLLPLVLASARSPGVEERRAAARAGREKRLREIQEDLRRRYPGWRGRLLAWRLSRLVAGVRDGFPIREDAKHHLMRIVLRLRRAVLMVGRSLVAEGKLRAVEHAEEGSSLLGEAGSPGVAEGVVRVLSEPSQGARLAQGEILVAPATDPGWTPLFPVAGALVMEVGGVVSHGVTVAREFGLPAVVGVGGATRKLVDGMRVRVDGTRGRVWILAPASGS